MASVNPVAFKAQIARFAPQFQGYAQQDSQELLAFLLDGLHEDLNRILSKPYIPERDTPGRPDALMAAEAWGNYQKRNDSVIVDHLQVLLQLQMVAPAPLCYPQQKWAACCVSPAVRRWARPRAPPLSATAEAAQWRSCGGVQSGAGCSLAERSRSCVQGLYRSELVCPSCHHRSVKFDPFTYLTLQLPSSKARCLTVTVLTVDGSVPPQQCAVSVPIAGAPACCPAA